MEMQNELLLTEYEENLQIFNKLKEVVMLKMKIILDHSGINVNSIEARVKTKKSLIGKLERKGWKYTSINDVTDIVGVRIIAYYNEDVDRIASMAEKYFEVDWLNSVDKRKMHEYDSFGYNSLHYICSLTEETITDPQFHGLEKYSFELQIRTVLQHVWSAIQHDIGYKSEIETPAEYHRSLSRLAGLLELADDEFSRIRTAVTDYRRKVKKMVKKGRLEEVELDGDSFNSFLELHPFNFLNSKIAAVTQAEIINSPMDNYLVVLKWMKMHTLADVAGLITENNDDAYQLALYQLGSTDIDILASTIGIQNLCIVKILKSGGDEKELKKFFDIVNSKQPYNLMLAQTVMEQARRLSFMKKKKVSKKEVAGTDNAETKNTKKTESPKKE